jgi:RNA polymerase sigma-70 factor (ECF subfamily)
MLTSPASTRRHLSLEEILRHARLGDPDALGALYDHHAAALCRTAYRLVGSRADAEDIVHDLFVGLPEALRGYQERGNLAAWLTRSVVRLALMRARADRRRRADPLSEASLPASGERTDARLEQSELQRVVMALPAGLRAVFMLKQVEGYSHDEIARMLGISSGASRVRFTRAIRMLRRALR